MYLKTDLQTFDVKELNSKFDVILVEPPLEEYQRTMGVTNMQFWGWDQVRFMLWCTSYKYRNDLGWGTWMHCNQKLGNICSSAIVATKFDEIFLGHARCLYWTYVLRTILVIIRDLMCQWGTLVSHIYQLWASGQSLCLSFFAYWCASRLSQTTGEVSIGGALNQHSPLYWLWWYLQTSDGNDIHGPRRERGHWDPATPWQLQQSWRVQHKMLI